MKKLFILFAILAINFAFSQTTIWTEDFESYVVDTGIKGPGTTNSGDYPANVTKWTLDTSSATLSNNFDYLMVKNVSGNKKMVTQDVDGNVYLITENINISEYTDVSIQVDMTESGSLENSDFYRVEYSLDGMDWIQFSTNGFAKNDFTSKTAEQLNLNGNGVKVRITTKTDTGSEFINSDYINLKGTAVAVACATPVASATALNLIHTDTVVNGDFTASSPVSSGYLVVRSLNNTLSATPADGIIYHIGDLLGGGKVIQASGSLSFKDTGLNPNTAYYYYVFSYNTNCIGGPLYLIHPLTGNTTTSSGPCLGEESFEGSWTPVGWTQNSVYQGTTGSNARTGTKYAGFNDVGDWLQLPDVDNPETLRYYARLSSNPTGNNRIKIQYYDGTNWIDIVEHTATTTSYTEFIADLSALTASVGVKLRFYRSADNKSHYIDDVSVFCGVPSPVIITSTANLTGFTYKEGNGPSAEQSFTVKGSNLTNNLLITPPTNWEISLISGVGFTPTTPITLTPSSGSVSETTIYTRMKAGLLAVNSPFSGDISCTSTGATTELVSVDGTVYLGCTQLFISEYANIFGGNYIEIYNPTSVPIDMSNYQIWRGYNGGAWGGADIISLVGTLVPGNVYVLAKNAIEMPIANQYDSRLNFNGDDNIGLAWNGGAGVTFNLIDSVGDDQGDPGVGWSVAGTVNATKDHTLVRKSTVDYSNTNWVVAAGTNPLDSEWIVLPYTNDTKLYHVSDCQLIPLVAITGNNNLIVDELLVPWTPNELNLTLFEGRKINSGTVSHTFTIWNAGNTVLNLTGVPDKVTIAGPNAADFTVITQPTSPVAPNNGNTDFIIQFNPTALGVRTAVISIANDNPFQNPYVFTVQGTGTNYTVCDATTSVLVFEDFEDAAVTYTTTIAESSDGSYDYFTRTDGTNVGINAEIANIKGNSYFGAQDTDAAPTPSAIPNMEFNNINIAGLDNLKFSVFLAEDDNGSSEDWDQNTFLHINYRIDGGAWENLIWIESRSSTNPNREPALDNNFNGLGDAGLEISDRFQKITRKINGKGNTLDIVFEFRGLTAGNEDIAIDNVKLTGDLINSTTWSMGSWSNGLPTETKKAIISDNYAVTSDIHACSCELDAGFTLTVDPTKTMVIETDIENNGVIIVENQGSIIQHKEDAIVNIIGSYKIKKTTTPYTEYDYTYWSSPINNGVLGTIFSASPVSRIYSFTAENFDDSSPADSFDDNEDVWLNISGNMTPGKGYIVMGQGADFPFDPGTITTGNVQNVSFNGKINNGDIAISVFSDANLTDAFDNQNLIGNPYPSAIDIKELYNANKNTLVGGNPILTGTFYFWTHGTPIGTPPNTGNDTYNFTNNDYATGTTNGIIFNSTASTGTVMKNAPEYIASGQGFFADIADNGTPATNVGTVLFNNDMRVSGHNTEFLRSPSQTNLDRVWLNMTNTNGIFRQILIGFFSDATDGHDNGIDGKRLESGNNFDFYSLIGNTKYAIQGFPILNIDRTVPIGVKAPQTGDLTISIDRIEGDLVNVNIYVKDNLMNTLHDLKLADFTFSTTQIGMENNRYEIVFSRNALAIDNFKPIGSDQLIVTNKDNQILVKMLDGTPIKTIEIFDVLGKRICSLNTNTSSKLVHTKTNKGSILFVKVTLDNDQVINKKIIKL